MNKKLILLTIIGISYFYGILTMYLKIFPFDQLQYIKNLVQQTNIHDKNRDLDTTSLNEIQIDEVSDRVVYVTYGQSNSVSSSQPGYESSQNVYMSLDGKVYQYSDPVIGGTGGNGSVWGRVGDLLTNRSSSKVVFVSLGWGGASLEELTYEHQYDFFEKQLKIALDTFGKIDGILFHQGESNHSRLNGSETYYNDFITLKTKIDSIAEIPIYLSQVSLCQSESDTTLISIQEKLINELSGVLKGPNSDLLNHSKYRLPDYCHFSGEGLDELANMWVEAITESRETM